MAIRLISASADRKFKFLWNTIDSYRNFSHKKLKRLGHFDFE